MKLYMVELIATDTLLVWGFVNSRKKYRFMPALYVKCDI